MAANSSRVNNNSRSSELLLHNNNIIPRKYKERSYYHNDNNNATSPERTKVWIEPKSKNGAVDKKVAVVYYLSRNGHLEHPHFIEVPLSSPDGLYLKDVIDRLNILRGKGMASLYSWSSKRSYKNGFVWHDLAENDFIYPAHGNEYVLKGSELLDPLPSNKTETTSFSDKTSKSSTEEESNELVPVITRRRNQSWSSIDLNEYKVYKTESFTESTRKLAADASTQTDDRRRRRKQVKEEEEIVELNKEEEIEISPPPSDSSPETLESLMKADGRLILGNGNCNDENLNRTVENCGRIKASSVLMQLISCGSISFRDCGATAVKEQGLSLIGHYRGRLPRGGGSKEGVIKEFGSFGGVRLEDKEYFSGSLIETRKEEIPALKRSNSYNADRSHLQLVDKDGEGGERTKCIPRKSKALLSKTESSIVENCSNSQSGSKRFEIEPVENVAK